VLVTEPETGGLPDGAIDGVGLGAFVYVLRSREEKNEAKKQMPSVSDDETKQGLREQEKGKRTSKVNILTRTQYCKYKGRNSLDRGIHRCYRYQ